LSASATIAERIAPTFHQKVWGSTGLSPWFPDPAEKTGEVWFSAPDLPLIKFLFTTDRLSVQVHPDDAYAREHENSNGKTEMWHILQAAPGAQVAIGFRKHITAEYLRDAALSGEIVSLLNWIRVRPGDTLFIAAGTVHAIGAGLALCEIQQQSDVTYRLYDYGRPRELHLDRGMEVSQLGPALGRAMLPVRCPFFYTDRLQISGSHPLDPVQAPYALIVLEGEGLIGEEPFVPGSVFRVPAGSAVTLAGRATLLRTSIPGS
jgi:mannose-6-phosphate isomerase